MKDGLYYAQKIRDVINGMKVCAYPALLAIVIMMILFFLTSCKTKTVVEYRDVNHYITKVQHDTVREKTTDSTFHQKIVRNDTVYDTKYVEKTRWRDKIREVHDTCWRDSIQTEYKEATKEVVKIPKVYNVAMIFSIICLIFLIFKLIKWLKLR